VLLNLGEHLLSAKERVVASILRQRWKTDQRSGVTGQTAPAARIARVDQQRDRVRVCAHVLDVDRRVRRQRTSIGVKPVRRTTWSAVEITRLSSV